MKVKLYCIHVAHDAGADLGKMLTNLLQNERQRRKVQGGSGGMPPQEIFSILTTLSTHSWLFESVRQYICQFHSPWMKFCGNDVMA